VLTDSDGAGFVIRNYLKGAIDPKYVKHAYIPDVLGKEKRKSSPSKEGKLGVEGMSREIIFAALTRAGVSIDESSCGNKAEAITKADFFELGLSGGRGSKEKRLELLKELQLPSKLSPNAMLDVLNALMTRDEFIKSFEIEVG